MEGSAPVAAAAAGTLASRQKNCNNCVSTKRRCDRRTPVCSRCLAKSIPCIYSKSKCVARNHSETEGNHLRSVPCTDAVTNRSPADSFFTTGLTHNDMSFLGDLPMDSGPDPVLDSTLQSVLDGTGDISMDAFMDLVGDNDSSSANNWLVLADQGLHTERLGTPVDEEIMRSYEKMTPFCDQTEPWHLYDPKTPLHWVTNRVKAFPADMATHNATPFLHRYLYREYTPQCILSCFATCVLYANRTPRNAAMVMRALHGSVRELVDAEAGHVIATPTEKLARTQALFLYQMIRLFDGDITLRAQGEKDLPLLQTWLGELCRIRENLGDLAQLEDSAARMQPPKEWERWIFAESLRRTVVIAYSVIGLYELMGGSEQKGNPDPWDYVHRWTLTRSLWQADSSFEFQRTWKEEPQFIISNYSFEKFVESGRAQDVDDFAEILLSVYMGPDATQEFLSTNKN